MTSNPHTSAFIVGEALIDAVKDMRGTITEHPGGSPANVALGLGRLGQKVHLLTWLGSDRRSEAVTTWLTESNVDVAPQSHAANRTSVASAQLQTDGSAQYTFDLEWDLPQFTQLAPEINVVHTGSIAAILEPGGQKVFNLLDSARAQATITYDPNARPSLMGRPEQARPIVEQYVGIADVVKVSDEDLEWLYPDSDPLTIAKQWRQSGPALVVVTKGGSGAIAFTAQGRVDVASPRVAVVDTVGAGDSFMGALIYGLGQNNLLGKSGRERLHAISPDTLGTVLDQCVRVAAITVSRAGANPPWSHEI